jgi:hypothetical protein
MEQGNMSWYHGTKWVQAQRYGEANVAELGKTAHVGAIYA